MLKINPYKYQEEGVKFLMEHHYAILGDEMGLGKTLQAIYLSEQLGCNTLVVCPAYLKKTWEMEWLKLSISVANLTVCENKSNIPTNPDNRIVIINYEQLKYAGHLFGWAQFIIADEVHFLKNVNSQRTQLFHYLLETHKPERFIGLSGTPITNRIPEFYSLIMLCSYNLKNTSGARLTKNYYQFCDYFSHRIDMEINGRRVVKYEGSKNIPELKALLKGKYIRRLSSNHLELPDIINKNVYVDYSKIDDKLKEEFDRFNGGVMSANSSVKSDSATEKALFTALYCQGLLDSGDGPLLVYSDHVKPIEIISQTLNKYRVGVITGSVNVNTRPQIVKDFQDGKLDVLVATIGSCSVGFTLTAANNVVFNDYSWVPANNMQAKKRIHRIGQTRKCIVHSILGSVVDEYILKTLQIKENTISKIL